MREKPERGKKSSKAQLFMEWVWLTIAALSLGTWVYAYLKEKNLPEPMLLMISGLSFLMYILRRYINKKKVS